MMEWFVIAGGAGGLLLCVILVVRGERSRAKGAQAIATLETQLADRETRIGELLAERDRLRGELGAAREAEARLGAQHEVLEAQMAKHGEELREIQQQSAVQFENLANRIFQEKSDHFTHRSRESLSQVLSPLQEHLKGFQETIRHSLHEETRERVSLKKELERICSLNEAMQVETGNLTQALKGDIRAQGSWGEMMLERILEESGLRRDEDYLLQGRGMKLKHPESGSPSKPDVIIKLPEERHLVIDAKVSLEPYRRLATAPDEESRAELVQSFLAAVRKHVEGLEQRRYQDLEGLSTPDFVLLFMPIEGAYALALQEDPTLHEFAWRRKVILVGPWSLYGSLKTIGSLWSLERQNRNAEEIAKRGGALYDKFVGFLDDLKKVGSQIDSLQRSYHAARSKLSDGRGNLVRQVEELKSLGAKAAKQIPAEFDSEDAQNAPEKSQKAIGE
ncbi:DNA recombination protein RmuC [bacterium]|nr:DNA recombination protein RmuC [bacterium]